MCLTAKKGQLQPRTETAVNTIYRWQEIIWVKDKETTENTIKGPKWNARELKEEGKNIRTSNVTKYPLAQCSSY